MTASDHTAVLFDFDGTLGDTETPAMEVAFWELAPYFPEAAKPDGASYLTDKTCADYIRDNAGKAFEFMVDVVEEDRKAAGLSSIEEARASAGEAPATLAVVDAGRAKFGLPPLAETRGLGKDILTLQKDETVDALSVAAHPCDNVPGVLASLKAKGIPFCISTTSGKPRVPVSVVSCGYTEYFPPEKIHSGESDFDPPRFKPDPSVYLLAAKSEDADPKNCVAVEDSTSGVGSAANANVGLIVGYVGGTHITEDRKTSHAGTLTAGGRSDDGRGADIVIRDMVDLVPLVETFAASAEMKDAAKKPVVFEKATLDALKGEYWLPEGK